MSKKTWIALGALIVVLALVVGVYFITKPQAQEGSKTVTVEIVHADGSTDTYTYRTDALYLNELLIEKGLIKEDDIVDGYFEILAGETASWDADQAYWSVYVNGEYALRGICGTNVEDGATYRFEYAVSNW